MKYRIVMAIDPEDAAEQYAEDECLKGGRIIDVQGAGLFKIHTVTEYVAHRIK